jgi:Galactose oxidase, central domain
MRAHVLCAVALLAACPDDVAGEGEGDTAGEGEGDRGEGEGDGGEGEGEPGYRWEALDAATTVALTPRWGAGIAMSSTDTAVAVGGVNSELIVTSDVVVQAPQGTGPVAGPALPAPSYCNCAIFDEARNELVVIGGRNVEFIEQAVSSAIDLTTGMASVVSGDAPQSFPVGCIGFTMPGTQTGYIFGGLSEQNGFTNNLHRYDSSTRSFSIVDAGVGPEARYDAATHIENDNTVLLVGGMGQRGNSAEFYEDVWRFSSDETWTRVSENSDVAPVGRRHPWSALGPDNDTLIFGYGSDSPTGQTVRGDLWTFSLSTGQWRELTVAGGPSARGFTYRMPGRAGNVGTMVGGFNGVGLQNDAWQLVPPPSLSGRWR